MAAVEQGVKPAVGVVLGATAGVAYVRVVVAVRMGETAHGQLTATRTQK